MGYVQICKNNYLRSIVSSPNEVLVKPKPQMTDLCAVQTMNEASGAIHHGAVHKVCHPPWGDGPFEIFAKINFCSSAACELCQQGLGAEI